MHIDVQDMIEQRLYVCRIRYSLCLHVKSTCISQEPLIQSELA